MWIVNQAAPADSGMGGDSTAAVPGDSSALLLDSTSLAGPQFSEEAGVARQTDTVQVYFRKKVNLNGTGVTGMIYLTADNDHAIVYQ